jgi:hypothetical protein
LKSSWLRDTLHMFAVYMAIGFASVPLGVLFASWKMHGHISSLTLVLGGICFVNMVILVLAFLFRKQLAILLLGHQVASEANPIHMGYSEKSAAASGARLRIETVTTPYQSAYNAR